MDLANILNVRTLNDYITATETIVKKCPNLKIQLNMTTVLNLKKVRSLEIEYFNKCEDHGAAFVIFEHMLKQPPAKTWGLLGKELVTILQYWLDAVRRHLISHNQHWWNFLKSLLIFIKGIKSKDPSLLTTIVELTTEGLLDLASNNLLDEVQRHQVLLTLNEYCAESSREQRNRMKDRLAGYFVKLSTILSSCGHLPTQLGILEALLRWLVGRHDPRVREAAAAAWFPGDLFRGDTVRVFLERPWRDFYQDARDFLNSHNVHRPDGVTSVVCKTLSAGGVALINGPQARETWLDVNVATRSVTVILDAGKCDALTVSHENVCAVQLYRTGGKPMLSIATVEPLRAGGAGGAGGALSAHLAAAAGSLRALDCALRAAFADKYQVLLDIDDVESSPLSYPMTAKPCPRKFSSSEEDRTVVPVRRRTRAGYIVRSRNQMSWNSPSTASTTSLAQLHDKLAALPHMLFNKEAVKVSIQPELSIVREASEREDRSSASPAQAPRVGVCQRQSDSELHAKKRGFPAVNNHQKSSLLLAASLGSSDEQLLKETYEKIYRNNQEVDLLDLLVKEAFNEKDSGIITDKRTQDTDVIENTPLEEQVKRVNNVENLKRKCTVVSNSTTDESNTEVDTLCYVTDRKNRRVKERPVVEESKSLDAAAVEAFFSQHLTENDEGKLVISPTLAKKINETSSEDSENILEDLDLNKSHMMIQAEIIDCLNNIVDEVSRNIDKCTEILSEEQQEIEILGILKYKNMNEISPSVPKEKKKQFPKEKFKPIKLSLQPAKKRTQRKTKQNAKQAKCNENKVIDDSAIEDDNDFIENTISESPLNSVSKQLIRKKRKLYSPKDDDHEAKEKNPNKAEQQPKRYPNNNNNTPIATCYKELELERQTRSRLIRKKRASTEPITSPRTRKLNDIFDKLKEKVDNEEKITQVDTKSLGADLTMYNFTSDSEDEDFKMKKTEVKKRIENNRVKTKTANRRRSAKRFNYAESNYDSSTDDNIKKVKKRKVVKQTKPRTRKLKVERSSDLIDERMREPAPEVLEISFVNENATKNNVPEPEPVTEQAPVMEAIANETIGAPVESVSVECNARKHTRTEILQIKKERATNSTIEKSQEINATRKGKQADKKATAKDVTSSKDIEPHSPLPGLVVETEKSRKDDITASVESTMLQKFHKIYREDPPGLTESVETQNLILDNEQNNSACENIPDVNIDTLEIIEEAKNFSTNKAEDREQDFETMNVNPPEEPVMETVVLSDDLSEKTIETVGKSPITGHNDLDELPPSTALLTEHIEHRNLEIQDMSQSMTEFFIQLRDRLAVNSTPSTSPERKQPSPVLPTRESSKDYIMASRSSTATPKVVLKKMCSKTLEKYASPSKSSVSACTPEVVLERMSSDELNKWLPIPFPTKQIVEKKPKRYNTRNAVKTADLVKKSTEKEAKIKSAISPITLSFDFDNINNTKIISELQKERSVTSDLKCKTLTPLTSRDVSKDLSQKVSQKGQITGIPDIICSGKGYIQNSSFEYKSSAEERARRVENRSDKSAAEKEEIKCSLEGNKSISSVNDWFKRNIATSSPSQEVTNVGKEILDRVVETLETTMEEIRLGTGKNLASMLVENQRCLNVLCEESRALDEQVVSEIMEMAREKWAERDKRLKELMEQFQNGQKERALEITRTVNSRTTLMVQLLKEDLQAVIDFNAKNK